MKIEGEKLCAGLANYAILCNDNSPACARLLILIQVQGWKFFLALVPSAAAISIAETAGFILARLGDIDGDRARHKILTVEHTDGFLGFFSSGHFHEAKAFCSARCAVYDKSNGGDSASLAEVCLNIFFLGGVGQVTYIKLVIHLFSNGFNVQPERF